MLCCVLLCSYTACVNQNDFASQCGLSLPDSIQHSIIFYAPLASASKINDKASLLACNHTADCQCWGQHQLPTPVINMLCIEYNQHC